MISYNQHALLKDLSATSGNLDLSRLRVSAHLSKFFIVDNVRLNYKTLNFYKNDYCKFDEGNFTGDLSLLDWVNILNSNLQIDD